ncbi:MAG: DUF459 domain-containing protein [Rhizobiaceae bacterium]|nr:DUF459 domain-containing protein [Rhizobiaceae bacterium]
MAAPPSAVVFSSHAEAQLFKRKQPEERAQKGEKPQERRGFFQRLFGIRKKEEPEEQSPRTAKRRSADGLPGVSTGLAGVGGGAVVTREREPEVAKLDNARVVLVVGDFLASGLGEGLVEAFAQSPGVRVVARSDGSSGFVRNDHYDWPAKIAEIIAEEKPAVVIAALGSNDRQQMTVGDNREKARTDAWNAEYQARAKAFADNVRGAGVPLLWMGVPSFKPGAMNADMIAFNDIYRGVVEQAGGEFIDIWDGFVDENGAFMPVGPDMNGQRVRLRGSDGINMTAAGKRKMAFYAEKPLNRLLGSAVAPSVAPAVLDGAPVIQPLNPADIDRTAPIALADPQLDGGGHLLGARVEKPAAQPLGIPVERLVREGIAPPAHAGRADDFAVGGARPVATAAPIAPAEPQPLAAAQDTTGAVRN